VREAIVSEMQPESLDRIEFGRVGRQEDQAEVFRHDEIAARMPAGFVHQHNAMRSWRDGLSEFGKKQVHCGGIEPGHHHGDTGVACRAYGADDPSRPVADIAQPARGLAALPPDIAGAPFLSDPRLVLAPDFKPFDLRMSLCDFRQAGSIPPLYEAPCVNAYWIVCGAAAKRNSGSASPGRFAEKPRITLYPVGSHRSRDPHPACLGKSRGRGGRDPSF